MNTPEFNPPENPGRKKEISWDLFILGIIFYKVMCGVHPFFGTCKPPYQNCTLPELKIREGLFPFWKKANYFEVIPTGHLTFNQFPELVQKLFINCFDDGVTNPNVRPNTVDWINRLTAKPRIKFFEPDKPVIFEHQKFSLSWETENAKYVEIVGIGQVNTNGNITLSTNSSSVFILKAVNDFGSVEIEKSLTKFPTPIIQSLFVPSPDFQSRASVNQISIKSPSINNSVSLNTNAIVPKPSFTELNVSINNSFPEHKPKISFWGISEAFNKIKNMISQELNQ